MSTGTLNTSNVSVGKPMAAGGIYAAPIETAPPTDAKTPLSDAFINLGYVSEDGLVNTRETDTESIKAWGGNKVLTVETSISESFKFSFIESMNPEVLKQIYGQDNVVGGAVKHNSMPRGRWMYVFEILLTGNKVKRIVVPVSEITEVGDITYQDGEVIAYECTLSAYPDKEGNTAIEYTADIVAPEPIPGV